MNNISRDQVFVTLLLCSEVLHGVAVKGDLSEEQTVFADALSSELYTQENECTSSLGVSIAFSLIYPSATGQSLVEMQEVFGYPSSETNLQLVWERTASELANIYKGECLSSYQGECERQEPTVEIVNSVWIHDAATLDSSYAEVIGEYARQLDFSDESAGGVINAWVENQTNGLIDSIVNDGSLDPSLVLIAINSLYLKAAWISQFDESRTNEDFFYESASRDTALNTKAHFMHKVGYFPYSDTVISGYQIVQLGFIGGAKSHGLSMIVVFPAGEGYKDTVSAVDMRNALSKLESTRLALALPKFKFESEYSSTLKDSLQSVGLNAPFESGLCVLEGSCSESVGFVVQKTVIDVNERGVEAAAVTAVAVSTTSAPTEEPMMFLCDHPFQFFIYDENEEVFLFEGRVGSPGTPEGSSGAQFQPLHSDADFWRSNFAVEPQVFQQDTGSSSAFAQRMTTALSILVILTGFCV
jgi:serpin B